ncbi:hypothetical protein Forpe1208_v009445 [Fusarium oxysporum f. sp. rapae]|uniref:Uncharacterized protein n=1 Tax=Fusarium oxysporum f. sp. rapae TaxID=485398 RepID=A0A8J5U874_FUSOX|nr:hypothetical protein Forpe1208_v009445 [Fusarium oxysporum f. sp. rapae]
MEKKMELEPSSFHITHDYVTDEYEPKDFVGRKTRSYKDLWRMVHTPNFKTIVWQYNPSKIGMPYPIFAPSPLNVNTSVLPIYIKIEAENEDHRSLFKGSIPAGCIYVPLFALIVIGLKEGLNFMKQSNEMPKSAEWQTMEPDFLSRTNNWEPKSKDNLPVILARKEDGSLVKVQLSNEWEGWHDVLPQMGILNTAAKHAGKPVRHLNIMLERPILIKPLNIRHEDVIRKRFSESPEQFFQGLINTIHKTPDPDASSPTFKSGYQWKLEIYSADKAQGYHKTSQDPFNLYETHIHQSDWNTYMKSLEKKVSPIRPFPRITKGLYDLSEKIMLKVGYGDIALQSSINEELGKSSSIEEEDLGNFAKQYPTYVPRKKLTAKAKAQAKEKMDKREKGVSALNKAYELGGGTSYLWNGLDADKIERAAGKRPDEAGQKEIMGGVSATEIGRAMGWGSKRLKSGVWPAEWLHLSAFSWGGLVGDDDPEGFTTSQNFENLVFGTSETNSLMTRYETAWQRFFLAEKELAGTGKGITGTLDICCNDFSQPILWDVFKDGNFLIDDLTFKKEELDALRKSFLGAKRYLAQDLKSLTDDQIREQMLILAQDFPFIVYSIQYDLRANFHSRVFALDKMDCFVDFFPFCRPFYHRAEAILDDLVFKKMYGKAKEESVIKAKI